MKIIIYLFCTICLIGCAAPRFGPPSQVIAFNATKITLDKYSSKFEIALSDDHNLNIPGYPAYIDPSTRFFTCRGENKKVLGNHEYHLWMSSSSKSMDPFSYPFTATDQDGKKIEGRKGRSRDHFFTIYELSQAYLENFLDKHPSDTFMKLKSGEFPNYETDEIPAWKLVGYLSKVKSFSSGKPAVLSWTQSSYNGAGPVQKVFDGSLDTFGNVEHRE
jgi:hypothetical protein